MCEESTGLSTCHKSTASLFLEWNAIVSGSVIASRVVGASADPCPGSIPVADAIGIAEARANGSAVSIGPDDDDPCLREVQVLSGAVLWEVKLARDGAVLEVEKSDADGE